MLAIHPTSTALTNTAITPSVAWWAPENLLWGWSQ